jgi:hypothetical protein
MAPPFLISALDEGKWSASLLGRFFFILVSEAIGTAATPGLLCQPRVIVKMIVEKHMECRLAGETEALGENLPQRHFCPSQNSTWPDLGLNPGRRGGKPATNRLSYGAASRSLYYRRSSLSQLDRRLGVPQGRFRRCGVEKNLAAAENRTPAL